jgi:uncharacterized Fe-S cluster-containing protein
MIGCDCSICAWHRDDDYAVPTAVRIFLVDFATCTQIFLACGACSTSRSQGKKLFDALTVLVYGSRQLVGF